MKRFSFDWILLVAISLIVLLPKFDLLSVAGTTTSVRIEDFILAAVYATWIGWMLWRRQRLRVTWVHKLMMLVVLIGAASTGLGMITGSVPYHNLGLLNILRRVEYFGMFWVAYTWLKPERLRLYLFWLLGISTLVIGIGILQFYGWVPMFSTWEGYSGQLLYFDHNFGFLISTFAGHYDLGGYLVLMTPLVVMLLLRARSWLHRIGLFGLLAGYYFLLYFSYSRAAYGAILVALVALFILLRRYWLVSLPVLDAARIVMLYLNGKFSRYKYQIQVEHSVPTPTIQVHQATHHALPAATSMPHTHQTLKLSNQTEVTLDPGGATRISVWSNAWHHFLHSPILGTGYSSIGTGADNDYLRMVAETGVLGLGAFLGLVGYIMLKFYKATKRLPDGFDRSFLLALIAGIIGLLAQAVLIDIFDSSKVALLLWFLVGLGVVITENIADRQ